MVNRWWCSLQHRENTGSIGRVLFMLIYCLIFVYCNILMSEHRDHSEILLFYGTKCMCVYKYLVRYTQTLCAMFCEPNSHFNVVVLLYSTNYCFFMNEHIFGGVVQMSSANPSISHKIYVVRSNLTLLQMLSYCIVQLFMQAA